MSEGKLLILSGPSGVGKGTVVKGLRARSEKIRLSVSATTRSPRPEDVEGVTYFFKTREEFETMLQENAFLEHAVYAGNYYGTPIGPVQDALHNGYDVILEIEPQGALQVKQRVPEAIAIFIAPPSYEELEQRLIGRGDTPPDVRQVRLQAARWECSQASKYDYIVINDDLTICIDEVMSIITAEKCRASNRADLFKEDL